MITRDASILILSGTLVSMSSPQLKLKVATLAESLLFFTICSKSHSPAIWVNLHIKITKIVRAEFPPGMKRKLELPGRGVGDVEM